MDKFYDINGKKIYVNIVGKTNQLPVLYLHGAPGVGVSDFIKFQKDNFKNEYYLIAPEQRGVWRSQELGDDEEFNIFQIIADYEEIRKVLGIDKWICLTQCSGARTAVQYYEKYPKIFKAFIFENPVFDNMTIFKEILRLQLKILKDKFGNEVYQNYMKEANTINSPLELESFSNKLGRKTNVNLNMILMSENTTKKLENLKKFFDYDFFIKSRSTEVKMCHNTELYSSIIDSFEKIKIPTMIIKGEKDIAVPMKTINEFINKVPKTKLEIFKDCKHWVHLDSPQKYFEVVDKFIKQNLKGDILNEIKNGKK